MLALQHEIFKISLPETVFLLPLYLHSGWILFFSSLYRMTACLALLKSWLIILL